MGGLTQVKSVSPVRFTCANLVLRWIQLNPFTIQAAVDVTVIARADNAQIPFGRVSRERLAGLQVNYTGHAACLQSVAKGP